jgi:hypothetical protein
MATTTTKPQAVSITDAALRVGLSYMQLYGMLLRAEIGGGRRGKRLYLHEADVRRLEKERMR